MRPFFFCVEAGSLSGRWRRSTPRQRCADRSYRCRRSGYI